MAREMNEDLVEPRPPENTYSVWLWFTMSLYASTNDGAIASAGITKGWSLGSPCERFTLTFAGPSKCVVTNLKRSIYSFADSFITLPFGPLPFGRNVKYPVFNAARTRQITFV